MNSTSTAQLKALLRSRISARANARGNQRGNAIVGAEVEAQFPAATSELSCSTKRPSTCSGRLPMSGTTSGDLPPARRPGHIVTVGQPKDIHYVLRNGMIHSLPSHEFEIE